MVWFMKFNLSIYIIFALLIYFYCFPFSLHKIFFCQIFPIPQALKLTLQSIMHSLRLFQSTWDYFVGKIMNSATRLPSSTLTYSSPRGLSKIWKKNTRHRRMGIPRPKVVEPRKWVTKHLCVHGWELRQLGTWAVCLTLRSDDNRKCVPTQNK